MADKETVDKILEVIEHLRPYLQRDGGDMEFVRFDEGIVYVRMLGACSGCAFIENTLSGGIEEALLEEVPGVIGVEEVM
jgi:Fe-S cluster biogenesis protein NfuA